MSVKKSHTIVFNVESYLYSLYVGPYIVANVDNRWSGKGRPLRLGRKSRCIALPMPCYIAHSRPTMFYIHPVIRSWDLVECPNLGGV